MSTMQAVQAMPGDVCRCLAEAWRVKSALRRRYLSAAEWLDANALHVVAHAFRYTAAQEGEHEAILAGMLRARGGECPPEDAEAPLPDDPLTLLADAAYAEQVAAECAYPQAAHLAEVAGDPRAAEALRRMAELERCHARRFRQYAGALAADTLFRDTQCRSWLCLACGQFHMAHEAPECCPSCGCNRGYFIRSDYRPFSVN